MKTRSRFAVLAPVARACAFSASLLAFAASAPIACLSGTAAEPMAATDAATLAAEPDDALSIPCAPRLVLQSVCQKCHQRPPIRGAPFPLVTRSNILRAAPDGEIRQLMIQQIEARRMPLAPETIDDNDRATLLEWLRAGAPEAPPSTCAQADAADATPDAETPDAPLPDDAGAPSDAATEDEDASWE